MRFSRREVVFYRLKIRSKTTNVAEVNEEKLREASKHFQLPIRKQSDLGTFLVGSPISSNHSLYVRSFCSGTTFVAILWICSNLVSFFKLSDRTTAAYSNFGRIILVIIFFIISLSKY
ncbi:hypothetical protein E2C01_048374 [Portunus trituberculatus]|uniref:Uncharacterized protein n=1 Tax=Portunus trituberculatus TaxID=210409 RepID=A0A5B7GAJ3_PORTR|nr:hypothetical protein [Portunus trituberculatus]